MLYPVKSTTYFSTELMGFDPLFCQMVDESPCLGAFFHQLLNIHPWRDRMQLFVSLLCEVLVCIVMALLQRYLHRSTDAVPASHGHVTL